jgi:O-antigen/teichoic acid export membrane protein
LGVLVAGNIMSSVTDLIITFWLVPGLKHRLCWDRAAGRELFHFGGWIMVSTACTFLAGSSDKLTVGKVSVATLGVYGLAAALKEVPAMLLSTLGAQLAFPLYSRLLAAGRDLREVFSTVQVGLAGVAAYAVSGLIVAGPSFFQAFYRPLYADAGWYVQWLASAAWLSTLQTTRELVLMAVGRTRTIAAGQVLKLICLFPLMLAGLKGFGPIGDSVESLTGVRIDGVIGLIVGTALAEVPRYVVLTAALLRRGLPAVRYDLILTVLVVAMCLSVRWVSPRLFGSWPVAGRLFGEAGLVTLLWGVVLAAWWRHGGAAVRRLLWPADSPVTDRHPP